jgi:hypothetical protein
MKINRWILRRDYFVPVDKDIEPDVVVNYLAVLFRVAAIGGITREEEDLQKIIVAALGIDDAIVGKARAKASDPSVTVDKLLLSIVSNSLRICVYRDAYRVALADGVVTRDEASQLDQVGEALKIPPGMQGEIRILVDLDIDLRNRMAGMGQRLGS